MQIKVLKSSKPYLSSHRIRDHFLDYFVQDNGHKFIRSSPVMPFCDNSIAFVNAGMNQFKNVFLGKELAPATTAANSQKCIRVGGKHNDLNVVGSDGYHHTFFEMLGNWSFGSYFKRDACTLAYNLLVGPYKINPRRLYVTYFGGDAAMNLEPDLECREIWREIGVSPDRILPFGKSDNFWEMGAAGPCGPCTEIHFDHITEQTRAMAVNQGLPDLTELWNLVFIQYNRDADGKITNLPQKHIDTGMGFERLAAILQEKESNYDTDLFVPLFDAIQRVTKVPAYTGKFDNDLDRDYRIVADHARMVTACIADGMFPDHSHKLSRILKKIILISEKTFKNDRLLLEIVLQVAEILGNAYPEMQNYEMIRTVVNHEIESYTALRKDVTKSLKTLSLTLADLIVYDLLDYPGFVPGYKDLMAATVNFQRNSSGKLVLPAENALKLHITYGLDPEAIGRVCDLVKLDWNEAEFNERVRGKKKKSSNITRCLLQDRHLNVSGTDDSFKYNYDFVANAFQVPSITAKIIEIIEAQNGAAYIITDKTNFYCESGGQEGDHGIIEGTGFKFKVTQVYTEKNCVLHFGHAIEGVPVSGTVNMSVDPVRRNGNIRNHTATHLLNAAVRRLMQAPTCQKSSEVSATGLKLELSVYGPRLGVADFLQIENECRHFVQQNLVVATQLIDFRGLLARKAVTMVPGEIYPDQNLRLIEMGDISAELCCGTHAKETGQLVDFCLTNVKLLGRASYLFTAIAGEAATKSHQVGAKFLLEVIGKLQADVACLEPLTHLRQDYSVIQQVEHKIRQIGAILHEGTFENVELPYSRKVIIKDKLGEIEEKCRVHSRQLVKLQLDAELKENTQNVIVLKSKSLLEELPLQKIVWNVDRPRLVIAFGNHVVYARCAGPVDTKQWMDVVARIFKTTTIRHDSTMCRLKEKRISEVFFDTKAKEAVEAAKNFLKSH